MDAHAPAKVPISSSICTRLSVELGLESFMDKDDIIGRYVFCVCPKLARITPLKMIALPMIWIPVGISVNSKKATIALKTGSS